MAVIGPSFGEECIAAGLGGLPFSWTPEGIITGRESLTQAQNTTLDQVLAAHNPLTLTKSEQRAADFQADTQVQQWITRLKNASNADIDAYFAANVGTAAQAIGVLKAVVKILAFKLRY